MWKRSRPRIRYPGWTAVTTVGTTVGPVSNRLIVAGGSVSGLYATIAGARAGFDVTLLEKFGEVGSRRTVFNLAPCVGDSLARLDDGGDELTKALQVIVKRSSDDPVNGQVKVENVGSMLLADADRPATAAALADGFSGVDSRPWSRVQIGGIENHMREYVARRFPNVDIRYDTTLEGIEQLPGGGVRALLQDGKTGAIDTLDGAYLVSATGGRNVLGVERARFPEQSHFIGGLFEPVDSSRIELRRMFRMGEDLEPATHELNPPGQGWATVGLPGNGSHSLPESLVWAQVAKDAKDVPLEQLQAVVRDRATKLGLGDMRLKPGEDNILKVNVQLGMLHDEQAVQGRVLLAGDELLAPYFPTSTGASHSLGVNGPIVDEALRGLRAAGDDEAAVQAVLARYDHDAREGAAQVMEISRREMLEDLGRPNPSWSESLETLSRDVARAGDSAP